MSDYQTSKLDPLSDVVALLKPQAVAWRIVEAHDDWSLRFPATDLVVFGQMIDGSCRIRLADGSERTLTAGDFILMAAPSSWTAHTADSLVPIDFESVIADPCLLFSSRSDPAITRFMAGAFLFAAPNADLLADLFLPMVHVRGAAIVAGRLGIMMKLLGDEALANRPGRSLILDRLLEIILIETLRHQSDTIPDARRGLLAGLADPQIGTALKLMHNDVQRPWTVAELARHVGMSRSSFAARFAETVGSPPIDYLSKWRITRSKSALTGARTPMSDIAQSAGYQSVSAFSTAFSRATGRSPTAYMKSTAA